MDSDSVTELASASSKNVASSTLQVCALGAIVPLGGTTHGDTLSPYRGISSIVWGHPSLPAIALADQSRGKQA